MRVTPNTLSVNQLFSGMSEQFLIPAYQRRYSWKNQQTAELFDDIYYLEPTDTHLLGTVVCLTEEHVAGINRLELVDGQQRLTTLSLLLFAFRERLEDVGRGDLAGQIDILMSARGQDDTKGRKVLLGDLDRPDYEAVLQGKGRDDVVNARLWDAYDLLRRRVAEVPAAEVAPLYTRLCNNASIIRLDIGRAKDAYKLFETINNRGLALSETDIFKNFLLGHASLLSDEVLEAVRVSWQRVIMALDGIDPDKFFRHLTASRVQRKVTDSLIIPTFKRLYLTGVKDTERLPDFKRIDIAESANHHKKAEEARALVTRPLAERESIEEFADGLAQAADVYAKIDRAGFASVRVNRMLTDLNRIRAIPAYVFLINLFQRGLPERTLCDVLWTLQVFMLRRHVCEYRTGELGDIFPRLVRLPDVGIAAAVKAELEPHCPPDAEFREKLPLHDFSGRALGRGRCVLEHLEYLEHGATGELLLAGPEDVHVEHIIPQTVTTKKSKTKFGDWIGYLGSTDVARHRMEVDTLGNLTLLSAPLNIGVSNNPFEAKLKGYRKSAIRLTQQIADEFTEFRFEQARQRGEALAEKAVEHWRM